MIRIMIGVVAAGVLGACAATYSNCDFVNPRYEAVCEAAVKKGVSYRYANRFLLSFRTAKRDTRSLELFSPKKIAVHARNERRANNNLLKYIPELTAHLKQYETVYDHAESKYRVNREVVAAILMKETHLGKIRPKHDAFIVFNTLLRELPEDTGRNKRLIRMAHNNVVSIMHYCYEKEIEPDLCRFPSSYAGAVGIPQFMPQNFGHIEGYRKKVGNLSDMEDAIVSTSRFLHYNAGFKELIDWGKVPPMETVEEAWYDFDFEHKNASFAYEGKKKQLNCYSCGKPELDYLRGYVKKVMRYNNSSHYAVGVLRLAYDAHQLLQKEEKVKCGIPALQ
jgi:membrane-bound lytic murein transglycosylase B